MRFDYPKKSHIPQLKHLWKEAFGDGDKFLVDFFTTAFDSRRSRCIFDGEIPVAMVYWFDIFCHGVPMAYLYAVAVDSRYRGRGFCRQLLTDTHRCLQTSGYAGALLVPADESLRKMYATMGYRDATPVSRVSCTAGSEPTAIRRIDGKEYHRLRQDFLPQGGAELCEKHIPFLETQYELYTGRDFLLAVSREESCITAPELLGNRSAAPGILRSLGASEGEFLVPGADFPFGMYCSLDGTTPAPNYFPFAFD